MYLLPKNVSPKECTSQGCHRGSDHSKTAVLPSAKQNVVAVVACCGLMVVLACPDAHATPPKRIYCLKNVPPEESKKLPYGLILPWYSILWIINLTCPNQWAIKNIRLQPFCFLYGSLANHNTYSNALKLTISILHYDWLPGMR